MAEAVKEAGGYAIEIHPGSWLMVFAKTADPCQPSPKSSENRPQPVRLHWLTKR